MRNFWHCFSTLSLPHVTSMRIGARVSVTCSRPPGKPVARRFSARAERCLSLLVQDKRNWHHFPWCCSVSCCLVPSPVSVSGSSAYIEPCVSVSLCLLHACQLLTSLLRPEPDAYLRRLPSGNSRRLDFVEQVLSVAVTTLVHASDPKG